MKPLCPPKPELLTAELALKSRPLLDHDSQSFSPLLRGSQPPHIYSRHATSRK